MGVIAESLCFCKGVGKSEKMKAAIFSGKSPAMARISGVGTGTGFLIHRNLLLTTHGNLPSVNSAECAETQLESGAVATLFPHRFFITSSVLDLSIVGSDALDGDSSAQNQQPHFLKPCAKPNLDLGSVVYVLGYTEKKELMIGEGKVVIATDNLIKLSTDGIIWSAGSAGFDAQGNLAFMICDPMKLATSPNTKSSSTSSSSSSSSKKDLTMQFGIPIPIICDWLNQHWEGSLDEVNKPKLPIIRLMSTGQKNEHSSASFTMRRVFKSMEFNAEGTASSSGDPATKLKEPTGPTCSTAVVINIIDEENRSADPHALHAQGIPTPEIYESPKVTSMPVRRKESAQIHLLDINFPPRITKPAAPILPARSLHPKLEKERIHDLPLKVSSIEEEQERPECARPMSPDAVREIASMDSVNDAQSDVQSCSSPMDASEVHNGGFSSEEETMYSAETAESRNYPSPKEERPSLVGRSQSCMNYHTRWGPVQRNLMTNRRALLEKQRSFIHGRKVYSHGGTSQRSNDYCSPTVSSIMKKRIGSEQQPPRPRQSTIHSSPRWVF